MDSAQREAAPDFGSVRRALRAAGFETSSGLPEAGAGRAEEAAIKPARRVEDQPAWDRPVGPAETWPGTVAFLDGIQRTEVVGYVGASPLLMARLAAAVRERTDRRLRTAVVRRRTVLLGSEPALAAVAGALTGLEPVALAPGSESAHPVRQLSDAAQAVDRLRGNLELEVGDEYRHGDRPAGGWMVVDGILSGSPSWAADPRMIGVSKSHASLPFDGEELLRYLRLSQGHRSPAFAPAGRLAPVHAWALRLWPWEERDLFHGLIRVEIAPEVGDPANADRISRYLLAERVPLSTPDPRWDRLLYGIRSVEEYLRRSG